MSERLTLEKFNQIAAINEKKAYEEAYPKEFWMDLPHGSSRWKDPLYQNMFKPFTNEQGILFLPEGVTVIPTFGLEKQDFVEVVMPNTTKDICNCAFQECHNLRTAFIPDSVVRIGSEVFLNCDSLESVRIGKNIEYIGFDNFKGCNNLKEIILAPGVSKEIEQQIREECPNVKITREKEREKLTLEKYNEMLENHKHWIMDKNEGEKADFTNYIDENGTLTIPDGATRVVRDMFSTEISPKNVVIPDSVVFVDANVFRDIKGIESVTIGNGVEGINTSTFRNCSDLTTVSIGNNAMFIDGFAFDGCTKLENANIGDHVVYIGNYAFNDCKSMKSITLPNSLKEIGDYVFSGCDSLKEIILSHGVSKEVEDKLRENYPNITIKREKNLELEFINKLNEQYRTETPYMLFDMNGENLACTYDDKTASISIEAHGLTLGSFTPDGFEFAPEFISIVENNMMQPNNEIENNNVLYSNSNKLKELYIVEEIPAYISERHEKGEKEGNFIYRGIELKFKYSHFAETYMIQDASNNSVIGTYDPGKDYIQTINEISFDDEVSCKINNENEPMFDTDEHNWE